VRELLYRLNDESATVLKANQLALTALTKHVPSEELVKHIDYVRNLIASMVSDARRRKGGVGDGEFLMPGFNIPKGEFLVLLFFSWMKTGHSYVCLLKWATEMRKKHFDTSNRSIPSEGHFIVGDQRLVFLICSHCHNLWKCSVFHSVGSFHVLNILTHTLTTIYFINRSRAIATDLPARHPLRQRLNT